jgi:hypothetical protein
LSALLDLLNKSAVVWFSIAGRSLAAVLNGAMCADIGLHFP